MSKKLKINMHGYTGEDYEVPTLPKSYLTITGIIIKKSIG